MAPTRLDQVLEALAEQEAVRYAAVTSGRGETVAEAGDVPREAGRDVPEATVPRAAGGDGHGARMMAQVGEGKLLHVGTDEPLSRAELRQLRSAVASIT